MSLVTEAFEIDDEESFAAARELLRKRRDFRRLVHWHASRRRAALLPGSRQNQSASSHSFLDTGNKYLSKMYNNFWMAEQGFIHPPAARRSERFDLASIRSWRSDHGRARRIRCSQHSSECATQMCRSFQWSTRAAAPSGLMDESDLLVKVHREPSHFNDPVRNAMTDQLETLPPDAQNQRLAGAYSIAAVSLS